VRDADSVSPRRNPLRSWAWLAAGSGSEPALGGGDERRSSAYALLVIKYWKHVVATTAATLCAVTLATPVGATASTMAAKGPLTLKKAEASTPNGCTASLLARESSNGTVEVKGSFVGKNTLVACSGHLDRRVKGKYGWTRVSGFFKVGGQFDPKYRTTSWHWDGKNSSVQSRVCIRRGGDREYCTSGW
jgi:hypothetical protein